MSRRLLVWWRRGDETGLLLALLIVAVVLPTVAFLWFMNRAMASERAAMQDQAQLLHRLQLDKLRQGLDSHVVTMSEVECGDVPVKAFSDLLLSADCSTVLLFDASRQLTYPIESELSYLLDLTDDTSNALDWRNAMGPSDQAMVTTLGKFTTEGLKQATDFEGRCIYTNLQLQALERLDRSHRSYDDIRRALTQRVVENSAMSLPTGQRLFLCQALRDLGHKVVRREESAEHLALALLEEPVELPIPGTLVKAPLDAPHWLLLTLDKRALLVFEQAHLSKVLESRSLLENPEMNVRLSTTATQSEGVSVELGRRLDGWFAEVQPQSTAASGHQQSAFYWAIGTMLLAAIGIVASFAMRRFLSQSKATQLRNDFLSTVSHELKTPLTSTRMLVDTLAAGQISDPERAQEYLSIIARENTRLSHLVEGFLTYSRLESGRMPFDFVELSPHEVVNHALDAVEKRFERAKVAFEVQVAESLPEIQADETSLSTAVINLLDNAYKYTKTDKQIGLHVYQDQRYICFEVRDNGIGIPEAEQKRIKERFYRVSWSKVQQIAGSGLGLSIVEYIVSAHKGRLLVRSIPEVGSRFVIAIPFLTS